MNIDRSLQAVISIVAAFSMLWTIAILIPDKSSSHNPLSLTNDGGSSNVIHVEYPRIILKPSSRQKLRTSSKSTQASSQSRTLIDDSVTQTKAMTTSQPTNTDESQKHETKRLFPAYVWYLTALFLYRSHAYAKKRSRKELDYADESFFQKSGLDASLDYGYGSGLEYEDSDFMSVTSNYGSASQWTPDSLNKFDLELEYEMTDSQI